MKKFLFKISLFFFTCILISQIPGFFLDPYYGNEIYRLKYEYYQKNQEHYNTLVMGSSRVHYHVNSPVMDEVLQEHQIKTFNLGAPATFNPEVYFLYERLLAEADSTHLKNVFIELELCFFPGDEAPTQARYYYWLDWNYLQFGLKQLYHTTRSQEYKNRQYRNAIVTYINNWINLRGYRALLMRGKKESPNQWNAESGFEPMSKSNITQKEMDQRTEMATNAYSISDHSEHLNQVHLDKILNLIELSQQKNIQLRFLIGPQMREDQYNRMFAIKDQLPEGTVIDLGDINKYPEFYQIKYTATRGHFTEAGANLFSRNFANEFLKLLDEKPASDSEPGSL